MKIKLSSRRRPEPCHRHLSACGKRGL